MLLAVIILISDVNGSDTHCKKKSVDDRVTQNVLTHNAPAKQMTKRRLTKKKRPPWHLSHPSGKVKKSKGGNECTKDKLCRLKKESGRRTAAQNRCRSPSRTVRTELFYIIDQ